MAKYSSKIIAFFVVLSIVLVITLLFINYLYSIDFSLKEHLKFFSYDTHYFKNFDDEYKEYLEAQVEQVNTFLDKTPDFFKTYENYCIPSKEGIEFYKKDVEHPEKTVLHKVFIKNWTEKIDIDWPNDGFGIITVYEEYPEYIFFENSNSNRFLIYTGGERPSDIIEKCYESYNSVLRVRLAEGWYDIILFDRQSGNE